MTAYQQAFQWKEFFFMEEGVSEIFIPLDPGDVNGDGNIDVADVATVIDVMSGNNVDNKETADVNKDGVVDVADIACIIDKMCIYEMLDD